MALHNQSDSQSDSQNLRGITGREATPEEVALRDGYVEGRNDEGYQQRDLRRQERAVVQAQANDQAASGMIFGLIVAVLAAGIGAAFYFLSGDRTNLVPVAVPQVQKETTIIEKQSPAAPAPAAPAPNVTLPDIRINVPEVKVPDVNITNEAPAQPAPAAPAPAAVEPPAAKTNPEPAPDAAPAPAPQ
jgi:hypothetical protein